LAWAQVIAAHENRKGASVPRTPLRLAEASRIVNLSERTLRSYIKAGTLGRVRIPGTKAIGLDPDEVLALKESMARPAAVTPAHVRGLEIRISILERRIRTLSEILNTQWDPLNLNAAAARELYRTAREKLLTAQWRVEDIDAWCDTFRRMEESDLRLIAQTCLDPQPGAPFLQLCAEHIRTLSSAKTLDTNPELQDLLQKVLAARRHLRGLQALYLQAPAVPPV